AEVSNQGGLGSLGLGASSVEAARQQILETQVLTHQPFQVNFFCHQSSALDHDVAKQWIEYLIPQFEKYNAAPPTELECM
ncbi:nitronate monooxygenase, partial [Pseudoalteromonas sp. SIMBA_148]